MCGICGIVSSVSVVDGGQLDRMLASLKHRGPDDEGVYLRDGVGLGNRRLSIIDPEGGHQPICNEDETVWIVYNGEIYNYQILRQQLEQKGHVFRTRTDTEVIVHLYEETGEDCVNHLNGMFAFAIWDDRQQKLVLARDRIGQKPLFYQQEEGRFLFGSETKALLAASRSQPDTDLESLHHYLSLRFIPSPSTMFRQIRKLPAAHLLVYQNDQVTVSRYWDLSFQNKLALPETELVSALRDGLHRSVNSHLKSDVPVGALLSGGMDSSMIVAIMAQDLKQSFDTFSVGVHEEDFNELPYARLVAEQYRTRHTESCVQEDLISLLPRMIWHLDEPSDPIAACQFFAAELAAQKVKVVLGGDGGDELFAGFDRFWGMEYVNLYAAIPALIRQGFIDPVLSRMPEVFAYKSTTQKMRWIHQLAAKREASQRYAEATCFFRFSHRDKEVLFSPEFWSRMRHHDSAEVIAQQYDKANADDPIDRMLYADFMTRLPEHSLMLTDRMAMAHGVELRSPFLDHELVELMASFPSEMKIRGRELKYVLRKLARHYLPEEIVRRHKQGFMFPVAYWFRSRLYPLLKELLPNSHLVNEGIFRKESVERLIDEHRAGKRDHHVRLWMLLNLEIWHRIYQQGWAPDEVSAELTEKAVLQSD